MIETKTRSSGTEARRRRAARVRRRHARHSRLSAEPRGMGPPHAIAHRRQEPRRQGRVHPVFRRSARAHRGPQSDRDAARAAQGRCSRRCTDAPEVSVVPPTRLARRQHAVSRRRQPPARTPQGDRRDDLRSADRRERRALSRARTAAAAGRHDLHPRARHDRQSRAAARSQCGAASESAAGDGAHLPPRAGRGRPHAALPRPLQFLARRTEADRIPGREPRRLCDAAGRARGARRGGLPAPLPERRASESPRSARQGT